MAGGAGTEISTAGLGAGAGAASAARRDPIGATTSAAADNKRCMSNRSLWFRHGVRAILEGGPEGAPLIFRRAIVQSFSSDARGVALGSKSAILRSFPHDQRCSQPRVDQHVLQVSRLGHAQDRA